MFKAALKQRRFAEGHHVLVCWSYAAHLCLLFSTDSSCHDGCQLQRVGSTSFDYHPMAINIARYS